MTAQLLPDPDPPSPARNSVAAALEAAAAAVDRLLASGLAEHQLGLAASVAEHLRALQAALAPAAPAPAPHRRPRLLVVGAITSDESLADAGVDASPAEDAVAALRCLCAAAEKKQPFDGVLIDAGLAGIGAGALVELIRGEPDIAGVELALAGSAAPPATPPLRLLALPLVAGEVLRWLAPGAAVPPAVLVVEDNAVNRQVVVGILEWMGLRPDLAVDGCEAVTAVQARRYQIVLMDVQMPEMDGLEATRRIREWERAGGRPRSTILALTANAQRGDRRLCIDAGMDDYVTKPVTRAALEAALRRHLGALPTPSLPERAPDPMPEPVPDPVAHRAAAGLAFDPAVIAALPMVADGSQPGCGDELIELFCEEAESMLTRIAQAAASGDTRSATRLVHTLKSSSAAVGACALAQVAAGEEQRLRAGGLPGSDWAALARHEYRRFEQALASHRRSAAAGRSGP